MNYLSVENLSKRYGERLLFDDITFGISKGQKVGIVAKNGSGKSTLLSILSGKESPDHGIVSFRKEIKVGVLDQDPQISVGQTIFEAILEMDNPMVTAVKNYEKALSNPDLMDKALSQMDDLKAWDFESKVKQVLTELKLVPWDQDVKNLSGGQRKRIALGKLLLDDPDFIILDEPTNHLDLEIIEWLENHLTQAGKTLLMVTHDRYFLERVCNEIIELHDGSISRYSGNYSTYLENKELREAQQASEVAKAQNLMKKELEWMRRQPKARGTKAKYRVDAFHDLKKKAKSKKADAELSIDLHGRRMGRKILEMDGLQKAFGDWKILDDFSYIFRRNEKIGIVGPNGVGKTTFLNILTGKEPTDGGTVEAGETVAFGYYDQKGMQLAEDMRVIEVVKNIAEHIPLADGTNVSAGQMLERFLFTPEQQYQYVRTLSGGERKRLYLLTILMKNPNFLILDEPTNDLDIVTLNVLEDYLESFAGCVLVVSHDRYFMDKVVDHLFVFQGQGVVKDFNGSYSDYHEMVKAWEREKSQQEAETKKAVEKPKQQEKKREKKKLSYKEQKEFEQLEADIEALENRKAELEAEMGTTSEPDKLTSLTTEYGEVEEELDIKTLRWMELAD